MELKVLNNDIRTSRSFESNLENESFEPVHLIGLIDYLTNLTYAVNGLNNW